MPFSASSEPRLKGRFDPRTIEREHFQWLRRTVKSAAGIHLSADRASIAAARIAKRVRATGAATFGEYIAQVEQDASCRELWQMIDALTVNQTCFYREPEQFPMYVACLRELLRSNETVNVWSAGCSTGEETFTLAMLAHSLLSGSAARVRFLGTDIASPVLRVARAAVYPADQAALLPPLLRPLLVDARDGTDRVRVAAHVRNAVSFARHNLVGNWRMRGPMHVIFCRNVLLYFDRPTQRAVVDAFCDMLSPGGYLFLGATERLPENKPLRYLQPAVYRKLPT